MSGKAEPRPYLCGWCGKSFKTRDELNVHLSTRCGTEKRGVV